MPQNPEIIPIGRFIVGVIALGGFFVAMLCLLAYAPEIDAAIRAWKGSL